MKILVRALATTPWLAALVSGIVLGLAFLKPWLGALAWVALVPYLIRWATPVPPVARAAESYCCFLTAYGLSTWWSVTHPMFGAAVAGLGPVLTLPLLPAFALMLAAPPLPAGRPAVALACAGAWLVGLEALSAHSAWTMPWYLLGYTQSAVPLVRNGAAVAGVVGLSACVLAFNAVVAHALLSASRRADARPWAAPLAVAGITLAMGLIGRPAARHEARPATLAVVQPGLGPIAWSEPDNRARMSALIELSDSALVRDPADLLIWPETALHVPHPDREPLPDELIRWHDDRNVPLLTGAVRAHETAGLFVNSAVLRDRGDMQTYDKQYLVPFAERVPFEGLTGTDRLRVASGGVAGYVAGDEARVLRTGELAIGPMICFESLFPHLARRLARLDAGLLVVLSQDGWWFGGLAPEQHLQRTRLRAVETGLPVVQATVSGVTAVIDASGAIRWELTRTGPSVLRAAVRPGRSATPFTQYGIWVELLIYSVALALLVRLRRVRRETRSGV